MKAIVEIEFIISVFVFVTSISFVTLLIVNNIPVLHNTAVGESLKSGSYQYSEMLLLDEGSPTDWDSGLFADADRIGFSSGERNIIDQNKLDKFNEYCLDINVGYSAIKNVLGLGIARDIVIEASKLDGTPVVGSSTVLCGPAVATTLRQQFQTVRLGVLPTDEIVKIKVTLIS